MYEEFKNKIINDIYQNEKKRFIEILGKNKIFFDSTNYILRNKINHFLRFLIISFVEISSSI
jgi:hypothetical protein